MALDRKLWPQPFSEEANAMALMRAKFQGLIPETVTDEECLDLMLKFAEFQSAYIENLMNLLNTLPVRHMMLVKP
jgi:hypothetical protein